MWQFILHILCGIAGVYIIETEVRQKPFEWTWRIVLALTGFLGLIVSLILYGIKKIVS